MNIIQKFDEHPSFKRLARRRDNFRKMVEHVASRGGTIIETGCAWDVGAWEAHGQSTLIWDWLAEEMGCSVISIDITEQSIESARKQTKNVDLICCDSVQALNEMTDFDCVSLLYLDSYDWSKERNIESAHHHLMELAACWRHLPEGCMIVVDDRHGDFQGKHFMVELFMQQLGYKPLFRNHQVGWIK